MNEWVVILGMMAVTFGVRYPVLALVSKFSLPERVVQALRYVPPAVLAAIILPEVLLPGDRETLFLSVENGRLVAAILALVVALRTKNLLLTIVIGMAALWAWDWVLATLISR